MSWLHDSIFLKSFWTDIFCDCDPPNPGLSKCFWFRCIRSMTSVEETAEVHAIAHLASVSLWILVAELWNSQASSRASIKRFLMVKVSASSELLTGAAVCSAWPYRFVNWKNKIHNLSLPLVASKRLQCQLRFPLESRSESLAKTFEQHTWLHVLIDY